MKTYLHGSKYDQFEVAECSAYLSISGTLNFDLLYHRPISFFSPRNCHFNLIRIKAHIFQAHLKLGRKGKTILRGNHKNLPFWNSPPILCNFMNTVCFKQRHEQTTPCPSPRGCDHILFIKR